MVTRKRKRTEQAWGSVRADRPTIMALSELAQQSHRSLIGQLRYMIQKEARCAEQDEEDEGKRGGK
jgi:hypothetical protein